MALTEKAPSAPGSMSVQRARSPRAVLFSDLKRTCVSETTVVVPPEACVEASAPTSSKSLQRSSPFASLARFAGSWLRLEVATTV